MNSAEQFNVSAKPRVLARTDRWLALFKPPGWLTIPGRTAEGAEAAPVLSEWAASEAGPVWVVHRLDRETSGIVLMARSAEAHREANGWFQKHEVRKAYDLLAQGSVSAPMMRIKAPVEGSPSTTQVEVKENYGGCFLARAVPLTGRRHQIRVHLAGLGFPLLGDPQYGGPRELGGMRVERVALHAARLELPTREVFEAPWPEDFAGWVSRLRESKGNGHGGK